MAFEADDHIVSEGWSVIVKGRAQVLNSRAEIREAERAQLLPWTAGVKGRYVRVFPVRNHRPALPLRSEPDPDGKGPSS